MIPCIYLILFVVTPLVCIVYMGLDAKATVASAQLTTTTTKGTSRDAHFLLLCANVYSIRIVEIACSLRQGTHMWIINTFSAWNQNTHSSRNKLCISPPKPILFAAGAVGALIIRFLLRMLYFLLHLCCFKKAYYPFTRLHSIIVHFMLLDSDSRRK